MEDRIAALLVEYGWSIASGILSALGTFMISYLLHRKPIKQMRQELAELREWKTKMETPAAVSGNRDTSDDPVYYTDAQAIVRAYIAPALQDMPDRVRLDVVHGFVERFGQTTGAMLREGQYNRERLCQWIESNAARFLVEHRDEMR